MTAWRPLVALILLSASFAGCLGNDDAPVDAAATDDDALNTAPPEGRGSLVAFVETNTTEAGAGGLDHHHDYWNGRDRVIIFETPAKMKPIAFTRDAANYQAVAQFEPPIGATVYESTQTIEFTLTEPGKTPSTATTSAHPTRRT